jgi:hypothetical protein
VIDRMNSKEEQDISLFATTARQVFAEIDDYRVERAEKRET